MFCQAFQSEPLFGNLEYLIWFAAGLPESSLLQVIGLSSAVPYDKKDPLNPINRRIAITVFNKAAEERVTREMESNPVSQSKEAASLLNDLKEDDAQPPPLK